MLKLTIFLSLIPFIIIEAANNDSTVIPTTTSQITTKPATTGGITTQPVVTTLSPKEECEARNSSCKECLKLAQCLWCNTDNTCKLYPSGDVLPKSELCSLDKARWGVCWVNFKVLLIVMGCIGGVILIAIVTCICCCCCCKDRSKNMIAKADEKWERKKRERKAKSDERRAERKARTDEIRRKYGLVKDDSAYQRFDNEV